MRIIKKLDIKHKSKCFVALVAIFIFCLLLVLSILFSAQLIVNPSHYLLYSLQKSINSRQILKIAKRTTSPVNYNKTTHTRLNIQERTMKTLSSFLYKYPWEKLELAMKTPEENIYRQKLIDGLQYYAFQEPMIPINKRCQPPPLLEPKYINCSKYPNAFLSSKYEKPVKILHAIQLGFDADSLEIHLNELYDVVDYFFILESTRVHCKTLQKQLMWSLLSVQPRFRKFRSKIIHLVLDDVDVSSVKWSTKNNDIWKLEELQEKMRWTKIVEWNKKVDFLNETDVLGFGDADEITSRENIQLLKYCPMKSGSLDIGIWFPFGRLDQAYASDFPVSRKYKYSLGDPTFYRWKDLMSRTPPFLSGHTYPSRKRGRSENFLLGGIHLTYYTYLPYFMLRFLSATECGDAKHIFPQQGIQYLQYNHSLVLLEQEFEKRKTSARIRPLKEVERELSSIAVLPWFYKCNKQRYPAWDGKHDSRVS